MSKIRLAPTTAPDSVNHVFVRSMIRYVGFGASVRDMPQSHSFSPSFVRIVAVRSVFVIVMAVNIEMRIPAARLNAKPLIMDVPK